MAYEFVPYFSYLSRMSGSSNSMFFVMGGR